MHMRAIIGWIAREKSQENPDEENVKKAIRALLREITEIHLRSEFMALFRSAYKKALLGGKPPTNRYEVFDQTSFLRLQRKAKCAHQNENRKQQSGIHIP